MKIRIAQGGPLTRRYECFACGTEFIVPMGMNQCTKCGESDNFHLMK